jgi:hypothetical protein
MNTTRPRSIALALLFAFAFGVLLAPTHARAGSGSTDRHEIPPFVLDRIELATEHR